MVVSGLLASEAGTTVFVVVVCAAPTNGLLRSHQRSFEMFPFSSLPPFFAAPPLPVLVCAFIKSNKTPQP